MKENKLISCQWLNGWSFTVIGYSFIFRFLKQVCLNCIISDYCTSDYEATFFLFWYFRKIKYRSLNPVKGKPAIPTRSLTACTAMEHRLMQSQAASDHGLHLLLWPCQASHKAACSPSVLFFVCVCLLNIFGRGENIYPQIHIIISVLLGYIIRVSKAWVLFSLLLKPFSKCNSKANWTCVVLEPTKCLTHCPWQISSLNSTC